MKIAILAAGVGSRLQPLTNDKPKSLLKIKNGTIIGKLVNQFKLNGFNEFIIVLGYQEKKLKDYLTYTFPNEHFEFIYNSNYEIMNNIYSFYLLRPFIKENNLLLVNSDLVCEDAIIKIAVDSPLNTLIVDDIKILNEEEMKVMVTEEGHISHIGKGLPPSKSYGEYIGLLKFDKKTVNKIMKTAEKFIRNGLTNEWYENVINYELPKLRLKPVPIKGLKWLEVDTVGDYKRALEIFGG